MLPVGPLLYMSSADHQSGVAQQSLAFDFPSNRTLTAFGSIREVVMLDPEKEAEKVQKILPGNLSVRQHGALLEQSVCIKRP